MKVSDILKTKKRAGEILSVDSVQPVDAAVKQMVSNDTGSVVVYDTQKRFLGMLTFREVLVAFHKHGYEKGSLLPCGDIVDREHGHYAEPGDSIDQIRNTMTANHIRYLPVMENGAPTAVISFYDVARSIVKAANYENRLLKEYIRNWPEQDPEDSAQNT